MSATLFLCLGLLAAGLTFGWLGARPPNPHRGPRMVPWRFLMLLTACALLVAVVHLVNLLGVTTGRA